MARVIFQSGDIATRGAHPAHFNIAVLDTGSVHLSTNCSGFTGTAFMDAAGVAALIEALTNALNRVEQVQS